MVEQYPSYHENDVWIDVPDYIFSLKSVVLGTVNAAKFLGISHVTLLKYADDLGLMVIRRPRSSRRYFLVSELEGLKEATRNVSTDDLKKGMSVEISRIKKKNRAEAKKARRR